MSHFPLLQVKQAPFDDDKLSARNVSEHQQMLDVVHLKHLAFNHKQSKSEYPTDCISKYETWFGGQSCGHATRNRSLLQKIVSGFHPSLIRSCASCDPIH